MKKIVLIVILIGTACLSLYTSEESSSSTEVTDVPITYIRGKSDRLNAVLREPNGIALLQELKKKCDDHSYRLSKEHKKILKYHKVLIKEKYGCFNTKKRFVVCNLVNSRDVSRFINENSIQSAESNSSIQTKGSGELLAGKRSAEDLEQVV